MRCLQFCHHHVGARHPRRPLPRPQGRCDCVRPFWRDFEPPPRPPPFPFVLFARPGGAPSPGEPGQHKLAPAGTPWPTGPSRRARSSRDTYLWSTRIYWSVAGRTPIEIDRRSKRCWQSCSECKRYCSGLRARDARRILRRLGWRLFAWRADERGSRSALFDPVGAGARDGRARSGECHRARVSGRWCASADRSSSRTMTTLVAFHRRPFLRLAVPGRLPREEEEDFAMGTRLSRAASISTSSAPPSSASMSADWTRCVTAAPS